MKESSMYDLDRFVDMNSTLHDTVSDITFLLVYFNVDRIKYHSDHQVHMHAHKLKLIVCSPASKNDIDFFMV